MRLRVCSDYKLGGPYSTHGPYSDEQGEFACPSGQVLAGIRCFDRYCDNMWYYCQLPRNFIVGSRSEWTSEFSEEQGDAQCKVPYYTMM